ncbi:MAG: HDOD domain-containing protein [Desulfovibrionaceae bacterium]
MVLGKDVHGSNGRLLLREGQTVEERHLRILNIWGVTEVFVRHEDCPDPSAECGDDPLLALARETVAARFAVPRPLGPPLAELERQCVLEAAAQLLREKGAKPPRADAAPPRVSGSRPPATSSLGPSGASSPGPDIEALTGTDSGLASLPDIHQRIATALDDPACTAGMLAGIISKDPGLSARILRMVNSPAQGLARKVDTLTRAVVVLGVREVSQLALGMSVFGLFGNLRSDFFPIRDFWRHSLACGVFARLLAARMGRKDVERFFVAGMLHDVGRLVMLRLAPEHLAEAVRQAGERRIALVEAERDVFGYTHCDVAARLLERWLLPESLTELVSRHHAPLESRLPEDASVIHVADALALAFGLGNGGQALFTGLSPEAWALLGQPESIIATSAAQARRQLDDIEAVFSGAHA